MAGTFPGHIEKEKRAKSDETNVRQRRIHLVREQENRIASQRCELYRDIIEERKAARTRIKKEQKLLELKARQNALRKVWQSSSSQAGTAHRHASAATHTQEREMKRLAGIKISQMQTAKERNRVAIEQRRAAIAQSQATSRRLVELQCIRREQMNIEREEAHAMGEVYASRQLMEVGIASMHRRTQLPRQEKMVSKVQQSSVSIQERFPIYVNAKVVRHGTSSANDSDIVFNDALVEEDKSMRRRWDVVLKQMIDRIHTRERGRKANITLQQRKGIEFLDGELQLLEQADKAGARVMRVHTTSMVAPEEEPPLVESTFERIFMSKPLRTDDMFPSHEDPKNEVVIENMESSGGPRWKAIKPSVPQFFVAAVKVPVEESYFESSPETSNGSLRSEDVKVIERLSEPVDPSVSSVPSPPPPSFKNVPAFSVSPTIGSNGILKSETLDQTSTTSTAPVELPRIEIVVESPDSTALDIEQLDRQQEPHASFDMGRKRFDYSKSELRENGNGMWDSSTDISSSRSTATKSSADETYGESSPAPFSVESTALTEYARHDRPLPPGNDELNVCQSTLIADESNLRNRKNPSEPVCSENDVEQELDFIDSVLTERGIRSLRSSVESMNLGKQTPESSGIIDVGPSQRDSSPEPDPMPENISTTMFDVEHRRLKEPLVRSNDEVMTRGSGDGDSHLQASRHTRIPAGLSINASASPPIEGSNYLLDKKGQISAIQENTNQNPVTDIASSVASDSTDALFRKWEDLYRNSLNLASNVQRIRASSDFDLENDHHFRSASPIPSPPPPPPSLPLSNSTDASLSSHSSPSPGAQQTIDAFQAESPAQGGKTEIGRGENLQSHYDDARTRSIIIELDRLSAIWKEKQEYYEQRNSLRDNYDQSEKLTTAHGLESAVESKCDIKAHDAKSLDHSNFYVSQSVKGEEGTGHDIQPDESLAELSFISSLQSSSQSSLSSAALGAVIVTATTAATTTTTKFTPTSTRAISRSLDHTSTMSIIRDVKENRNSPDIASSTHNFRNANILVHLESTQADRAHRNGIEAQAYEDSVDVSTVDVSHEMSDEDNEEESTLEEFVQMNERRSVSVREIQSELQDVRQRLIKVAAMSQHSRTNTSQDLTAVGTVQEEIFSSDAQLPRVSHDIAHATENDSGSSPPLLLQQMSLQTFQSNESVQPSLYSDSSSVDSEALAGRRPAEGNKYNITINTHAAKSESKMEDSLSQYAILSTHTFSGSKSIINSSHPSTSERLEVSPSLTSQTDVASYRSGIGSSLLSPSAGYRSTERLPSLHEDELSEQSLESSIDYKHRI